MLYKEIDTERANEILNIVEEWGRRSENKETLAKAHAEAENTLCALILTGVVAGYFPNIPNHNQLLFDKLRIAFEIGYYYAKR